MTCFYCEEPLDQGGGSNIHKECAFRMIAGSAAHQLHECTCFGGTREDPPEMSTREAAKLALETYRLLHEQEERPMTAVIKTGQRVRVYPHGSPAKAAVGNVVLISSNQRAIAVCFEEVPPFAFSQELPLIGIHPDGIMLLACRPDDPLGPWVELASACHYEIEAEADDGATD
jgi:hypothetical protein